MTISSLPDSPKKTLLLALVLPVVALSSWAVTPSDWSKRMGEPIRTEPAWAKTGPVQWKICRESVKQSEIDGLIALHRSPVGQSFAAKMPGVTQNAMVEMPICVQQVMPKMQAGMAVLAAEIKFAK